MSQARGTVLIVIGSFAAVALAVTIALLLRGGDPDTGPPAADTTIDSTATTSTSSTLPTTTTTAPTTTTTTLVPMQAGCIDAACLDTAIDFLIVTRPLFVDALRPYVAWKVESGFQVGLVTVDWLAENYEGDHLAEQMKHGMHDIRRHAAGDGTIYVLLVGDTEIPIDELAVDTVLASYDLDEAWNTPTGFYRRIDNDPEGEVLPSDAYFVEDSDWDVAGTGLNDVGGPHGQGSMQPSLYIGRWPVREPGGLAPIIAKTVSMTPASTVLLTQDADFTSSEGSCCDRWPPNDEWFGYGTRACCYLDNNIVRDRLLQDADWLDFTEHSVAMPGAELDDYEPLWSTDGAVIFSYHGWYDCVQLQFGACNGITDFRFDHTFSLFEASSCYIAAFYAGDEPTLSESLFSTSTGPAVFAQSGHNTYQFIENAITGMPVGDAFWIAAETYVYWLNPILLLGDPSLPVFTGP